MQHATDRGLARRIKIGRFGNQNGGFVSWCPFETDLKGDPHIPHESLPKCLGARMDKIHFAPVGIGGLSTRASGDKGTPECCKLPKKKRKKKLNGLLPATSWLPFGFPHQPKSECRTRYTRTCCSWFLNPLNKEGRVPLSNWETLLLQSHTHLPFGL